MVFPTHVGVFPHKTCSSPDVAGLPHARGGVSELIASLESAGESSPRTWGCFSLSRVFLHGAGVFPTHVGVFLGDFTGINPGISLPHARGGVSISEWPNDAAVWSSPRTWGCFFCPRPEIFVMDVFPTHVGVFLSDFPLSLASSGLPHARGGVSHRLYVVEF